MSFACTVEHTDQGVVTPIGPVLTTATAVKGRISAAFGQRSKRAGANHSQLANLITRGYPKSRGQRCKIGAVKRSRPFLGGQTV